MKRIIALLLTIVIALTFLTSCSSTTEINSEKEAENSLIQSSKPFTDIKLNDYVECGKSDNLTLKFMPSTNQLMIENSLDGSVWLSNPQNPSEDVNAGKLDQMKMMSVLELEYANLSSKKRTGINIYTSNIKSGKYEIFTIQNGVVFKYNVTEVGKTLFLAAYLENGNFIYSFCEDESGQALYENVQASVDAARTEGADYVVAVAHLGVDVSSAPWRSTDVIANTHGIDVMIDGHSHTAIDGQEVLNEDGETVLLNQTGTKLSALGQVVIDPDTGEVSAGLITEYQERDPDTQAFVESINQEFSTILSQVVASTDVALTTVDPSTGERIIRSQETNLGDLCADAYREVLDADVGLINGGGIRADIAAGEITYEDIISVHPYNNQATSVRVTGQQLLDALELGARYTP